MKQTQASRDSRSMVQGIDIATIKQDINYIKANVDKINAKLENDYVTREEFDPYKKIITGMVGIILAGALAAILRLVFIK